MFCSFRGAVLFLFLSLLVSPVVFGDSWTVFPTTQVNCTGYTDFSAKQDGPVLVYGGAVSGPVRKGNGYLKFDTSAIPDGTLITSVAWQFYVSDANAPFWSVTPLTVDPASLAGTAGQVWEDLEDERDSGYYNYLSESVNYTPGWKSLMLGGTASQDFTASLAQDWFAFGGVSRDPSEIFYQQIDGHTGPNIPYLVVSDTPPPVNDSCAGAIPIPAVPGTASYSGDTTWANDLYNCSASCVGSLTHGGGDVVYTVTLPAGCEICVTLNQSMMSWNAGIYLVTDCADVDGTCVAGSSGWLPGDQDEQFCFSSPVSETYYLIVDGRSGGGAGPFQLGVDLSCLAGPSDLVCIETPAGIDLLWTNNELYDSIDVFVDGVLETTLPGTATTATVSPDPGYHCLHVCGSAGVDSGCSDVCCLIFGYEFEELLWDFEENDGGFVVQGTGAWQWGEATFGPCTEPAFGLSWATALHQEYDNNCCWLLDSEEVDLGAVGRFLSIDHCYDAEFGYDGGVVWFTTDDFWYNTSEPVKGADAVINGGTPLCSWVENQKGFTGNSGGWVTDHWDLTDVQWHNQTVKLRFAFAADSTITAPGWVIDNITLYSNHVCPLSCDYIITPTSGTVPFQTIHRVTLYNNLTGGTVMTRRLAGRIAVTLAGGTTYNPWRAGFTTIAPASFYSTQFPVNIPALGQVIGSNTFTLTTMDVTPAPYNQPPYPASGSTCSRIQIVDAFAP